MDNALVSFSATFLGVFLAFGLTYLYDRRREAARERSDLRKVLSTLRFELASNLRSVTEALENSTPSPNQIEGVALPDDDSTEGLMIPYVILERSALDTAINSGRLFLLSEDALHLVMSAYQTLDVVNTFSQQLLAISSQPQERASKLIIENHSSVVASALAQLKQELPNTIERMDALAP